MPRRRHLSSPVAYSRTFAERLMARDVAVIVGSIPLLDPGDIAGEADTSTVEARLLTDPNMLAVFTWERADYQTRTGVSNIDSSGNISVADYSATTGGQGKQLRVKTPAATQKGFGYHTTFDAMSPISFPAQDEVYFRYRVYFGSQFQWNGSTGSNNTQFKMPGLAGKLGATKSRVSAGGQRWNGDVEIDIYKVTPDVLGDADGFSCRMIGKGGSTQNKVAVPYLYIPDEKYVGVPSTKSYFGWGNERIKTTPGGSTDAHFVDGWNTIEQRVKVNTVGLEDGIFEVWLNGVKGISKTDMVFRTATHPTLNITQVFWSYFHGGGSSEYPSADSYIYFDDGALSLAYIGPPTDGR